jgi:hypothetical protein
LELESTQTELSAVGIAANEAQGKVSHQLSVWFTKTSGVNRGTAKSVAEQSVPQRGESRGIS